MARLARIVVPGLPHHVTQRGNRRGPIFFEPGDARRFIATCWPKTAARPASPAGPIA
jgi:REP element-mobilizing transposase RayT